MPELGSNINKGVEELISFLNKKLAHSDFTSVKSLNSFRSGFFKEFSEKKKEILASFSSFIEDSYNFGVSRSDTMLKEVGLLDETIFNKPHKEALSLLKANAFNDLNNALSSLQNSAVSYFSRVRVSTAQKEKLKDIMEKGFFEKGESLNVVRPKFVEALKGSLKDGRILAGFKSMKINAYASLLVRTLGSATYSRAAEMRMKQNNVYHVIISSHSSKDWCSFYEGKVFSLVEGDKSGYPFIEDIPNGGTPFHPNCAHVEMPYVIELNKQDGSEKIGEDLLTQDTKALGKRHRKLLKVEVHKDYNKASVRAYKKASVLEREAAGFYTGPGHKNINRSLRSGNVSILENDNEMFFAERDLSNYLETSPKFEGVSYRGGSRKYWGKLKQGDVISDKAYMSSSFSKEVTDSFMLPESTMFKIKSNRGTAIELMSRHEKEMEVLFQKNSVMEVLSVKKKVFSIGKTKFDIQVVELLDRT